MRKFLAVLTGAVVLSFFQGACVPRHEGKLRVGLMPAVNSIPLLIAEENGYFRDENAEIELVMFTDQLYREAALQSGEIDGSVSDMINAIGEWNSGLGIRVTSLTEGRFALLSSPALPVKTLPDVNLLSTKALKTGLLRNSIVYYVTEKMLELSRVDASRIDLIPTPQIPARLEMLLAGRLDLACLPEPITRIAAAGGAHILAETDMLPEPPGVLLFTDTSIKNKRRAITALYNGYNKAVQDLAAAPDSYRDLIVKKGGFPPSVRDTMVLPAFAQAGLPSERSYADVAAWMIGKGLVESVPAYTEIVDPAFILKK